MIIIMRFEKIMFYVQNILIYMNFVGGYEGDVQSPAYIFYLLLKKTEKA